MALFRAHAVLFCWPSEAEYLHSDFEERLVVADPSEQYDFLVRFFAPWAGIDEDPVTGSSYAVAGAVSLDDLVLYHPVKQ
jgi:predicted PhzF superfamily epimerase YddE/YHI9